MREAGSEVGAINVDLPLSGNVDVLAAWAVDLDAGGRQFFAYPDRQHVVAFAEDARAVREG